MDIYTSNINIKFVPENTYTYVYLHNMYVCKLGIYIKKVDHMYR